jgi:hypothetical protein
MLVYTRLVYHVRFPLIHASSRRCTAPPAPNTVDRQRDRDDLAILCGVTRGLRADLL